jgi:5,10-methylenetetrahydromethanopterin reductase
MNCDGVEFWRAGGVESSTTVDTARRIEAEGWDGQMFMDSQSLSCDPYVCMGVWAAATRRLKLCTGVTNPLTRHAAVTAASAATVQSISGGRAILGIGRGDSALAYLGHAPVRLDVFRRVLEELQILLRGGEIEFPAQRGNDAPSHETLSLAARPTGSGLQWLPPDLPKVPLDVAATGPKVIEIAAPIAERITFSVGADPARVQWALDLARAARRGRALPDEGVSYGAQVIVICHRDVGAARAIAARFVAPLARFQVIQGNAAGPQRDGDVANFDAIRRGYDMKKHGDMHAHDEILRESLTVDFVERFAILGPPERCAERLLELHALGIDRFVIVGPGYYPEPVNRGSPSFASEVMPVVRGLAARRAHA